MQSGGAASGPVDALKLAALAATASSAASNTAYAVDAIVKEAVLFFATMPQPAGQASSEEVFKVFGMRAHTDARAAADACALTHQLVAQDSSAGGGGKRASGGGNVMAAVLAAGHVGTHADRAAATAREAAQLCMGILEEAVQATASPLARETAKRCAEQALNSIEVASIAEQHNRKLNELITSLMLMLRSSECAGGRGLQGGPALVAVPAPQANSGLKLQRWWDVPQTAAKAVKAAAAPEGGAAAVSSVPLPSVPAGLESLEAAVQSAESLEKHVTDRVNACVEAKAMSQEDERALRVIIEWRFGHALSLLLSEEEVLSESDAARLAAWRHPPDEALPSDLLEALQRHGGLAALSASLRGAVREPLAEPPGACPEPGEGSLPFPGPFKHALGELPESSDWDGIFERLGWVPLAPTAQAPTYMKPRGSVPQPSQEQVLAGIAAWEATAPGGREAQATDPADAAWDVEGMTSRLLHIMSMQSRSKQRRSGIAKHKVSEDLGGTATASSPLATGAAPARSPEAEEAEVRQLLADVLGPDWEVEDLSRPPHEPLGGRAGVQSSRAAQEALKRTAKKKKPLMASGSSQSGSAAMTFSPVHRLIEPPQLLSEALSKRSDEEVDALHDEEAEPSDRFRMPLLGSSTSWDTDALGAVPWSGSGPYVPGQLLQQRTARTFNESMEHIAVERRRAYGFGCRSWISTAPGSGLGMVENRARTFNEGVRPGDIPTPIATPAGTFVRTPTWTSADSGEFGGVLRDDPSGPLYVQSSQRWISEEPSHISSGAMHPRAAHWTGCGGASSSDADSSALTSNEGLGARGERGRNFWRSC